MDLGHTKPRVALIVGVTGMVGHALAHALKSPTSLGGPWIVYGVSRSPLPTWFPTSILDKAITLDTLDQDTVNKILTPLASQITNVFWLALQVSENEQLSISLNSTMLTNVVNTLTSSHDTKLSHVTVQTGTLQYLGPIFDPILSAKIVPCEPPFKESYPRLPFPNFYYALEDILATYSKLFTYSVHRSSMIVGASTRSYFNIVLTLSMYALICKRGNYPFRYIGCKYSWENFADMSEARVLAEQQIWASVTPKAKNQAFNCTNGDVFTWKQMWVVFCDLFGVEFVPFDEKYEFSFGMFMKDKGRIWDEIVEENGLYKTKVEDIASFGAIEMIFKLEMQHLCSMNKSRELGFHGFSNTLASIRGRVEELRRMKILP